MSIFSAAQMAMWCGWRYFDDASECIDRLIACVNAVPLDEALEFQQAEISAIGRLPGAEEELPDVIDVRPRLTAALEQAQRDVEAARLLCQNVEAWLPE